MSDNKDHKIPQRLEVMEKTVRNMRIAIIMIAAFFVYQALAPSGLWKGIEVKEIVKMKELIIIDDHGHEWARLGAGSDGGRLILDNEAGNRLKLSPDVIRILKTAGDGYIEQVQLDDSNMIFYDEDGKPLDIFPLYVPTDE